LETKKCNKCGRELPLTEEYFSKRKDSSDGFRGECKPCRSEYNKQYRIDNIDEYSERKKQHYINNKERINQKSKIYYIEHKKEITLRNKQYYQANREAILRYAKQYNEENKKIISRKREKRQKNNKKEYLQYWRIYNKKNKEKRSISREKRRTKKKQLPSTLTHKQWQYIKDYFNGKCAYCGKELPLAQDHFIPLSKGGEYTHNNIIPACKNCNSSKKDKLFYEWYPKYKYFSKKREKLILKFLGYIEQRVQQTALFT